MNTEQTNDFYRPKITGAFFLLVFLAYGFGQHFFVQNSFTEKYLGAALILLNSIMVVIIGLFLKRSLNQSNGAIANIYFYSRFFEAIVLGSITLNLFSIIHIPIDTVYHYAMLGLGLGSIPMCLQLGKSNLAPKWLVIWGAIGYSMFAFGFLMELFGFEWSMYLLGIAGSWELTFGVWLIMRKGKIL